MRQMADYPGRTANLSTLDHGSLHWQCAYQRPSALREVESDQKYRRWDFEECLRSRCTRFGYEKGISMYTDCADARISRHRDYSKDARMCLYPWTTQLLRHEPASKTFN